MSGASVNGHPVREDGTVDDSGVELELATMRGGPLDGVQLQVRPQAQVIAFPYDGGGYIRMPRSTPVVFYWSTVPPQMHLVRPGMSPRTLAWGCTLGIVGWVVIGLLAAWAFGWHV